MSRDSEFVLLEFLVVALVILAVVGLLTTG